MKNTISLALVLLLAPATALFACQEDAPNDRIAFAEALEKAVREEYKLALLSAMKLRVSDMGKHLKLDAKTIRRLNVAAKGAATRTSAQSSQEVVNFLLGHVPDGDFMINGRRVSMTEKNEDNLPLPEHRVVLVVEDRHLKVIVHSDVGSSGSQAAGGLADVREEKLWRDTTSTVLSVKQRTSYDTYQANRRRELCLNLVTSAFSLEMKMDAKQTARFREWAGKQIKSVSEEAIGAGGAESIRKVASKLKVDGLDKFLTPDQLKVMRTRLAEWNR